MTPWSTIVVGTDGSDTAARAVGHAAALAAATDATLVVVTAYSDSGDERDASSAPADVQWALTASAGAEELARSGVELASGAGARSVRARTARGDPTSVLLEVASETEAGLIVVGSKGMTSASRFVTGSVPNALSHHADRDVLIVHTD